MSCLSCSGIDMLHRTGWPGAIVPSANDGLS